MILKTRIFMIVLTAVNFSLIYTVVVKKDCGSMDIRTYKALDELTNCTAVLGNLALVFPPTYDTPDYSQEEINNRSFPLREITGFMFVYSVALLDSLGHMFPNLTVIRGHRLFSNYALVIYQTELVEITLRNLLKISRGSVRIDGPNDRLCLPKIDWEAIVISGKHFIGKNSTNANCKSIGFDRCHSCEEADKCWHNGACQRFEKSYKGTTTYRQKSCHPLCLGECFDRSASGCFTCKDLSEDSRCVEECSENRLLHVDSRRCVDFENCVKANRSILITPGERLCVQDCPSGYTTQAIGHEAEEVSKDSEKSHCRKCQQKCPKYCKPKEIRRVSQLEDFGIGCTIIDGDLEIRMVDDINNLTAELQTYLGDVEEILGVLKIHRSPPLTSLTFLNRLRVVEGRKQKPAISIFENQNLQTIFDWRARGNMRLKVKTGYIQIYNNILLCSNETRRFQDIIDRPGKANDLVQNNGGKNKCAVNTIETSYHVSSHDTCSIRWHEVNTKTKQRFNAYIIQYVSIKSSSSSSGEFIDEKLLLERDSCSSYGWQHVFVKSIDWRSIGSGQLEFNLTGLSQFSSYAFLVQTYQYGGADDTSLESEHNITEFDVAISQVKTFRTNLKVPSRVKNFETLDKSSSSVTLQWGIAESEGSAITAFYLDIVKNPFNVTLIDRRDYCANPIDKSEEIEAMEMLNNVKKFRHETFKDDNSCCERCCRLREKRKMSQQLEDSDFEADLVKLSDAVPRSDFQLRTEIKKLPTFVDRIEIAPGNRNYTIANLDPFTVYTFYIYACSGESKCSEYELHTEITLVSRDESFDRVRLQPSSYTYESTNFYVHFQEPTDSNGVIINYVTELREIVGNDSIYLFTDCVTRLQHQMNGFKYSLNHLLSGIYEFRVMGVSLGHASSSLGKGPYTDFHEFHVVKSVRKTNISKGWILLGVMMLLLLVCGSIVSYYYKHKIMVFLQRHNDTIILMQDMEQTDFHEISLHHRLSDIIEFDDE